MLKVAICESSLNPKAFNKTDGIGGSYGVFQFQKSTFLRYSKQLNEELDYYSTYDQAKVAAYMFSLGQQRQWSCYQKTK